MKSAWIAPHLHTQTVFVTACKRVNFLLEAGSSRSVRWRKCSSWLKASEFATWSSQHKESKLPSHKRDKYKFITVHAVYQNKCLSRRIHQQEKLCVFHTLRFWLVHKSCSAQLSGELETDPQDLHTTLLAVNSSSLSDCIKAWHGNGFQPIWERLL